MQHFSFVYKKNVNFRKSCWRASVKQRPLLHPPSLSGGRGWESRARALSLLVKLSLIDSFEDPLGNWEKCHLSVNLWKKRWVTGKITPTLIQYAPADEREGSLLLVVRMVLDLWGSLIGPSWSFSCIRKTTSLVSSYFNVFLLILYTNPHRRTCPCDMLCMLPL